MSIQDEIRERVRERRLFAISHRVRSDPIIRPMFVTKELNDLLSGPWPTVAKETRYGALKADLDFIVAGGLINKGLLKPLRKRSDEVWEIRSREPTPSIRVFGRFTEPNVFVCTNWEYRWFLEFFDQWRRHKRKCTAVWRQLFGTYLPYKGGKIRDYVTSNTEEEDYDDW